MNPRRPDVNRRIGCLVPGCRRTIEAAKLAAHHNAWICPKHWALVPKGLKRAKARHEREFRRHGFYPREAGYCRVWRACSRHAGVSGR